MSVHQGPATLDIKNLLELLDSHGPLSLHIKGFEARDSQKEMLSAISSAYNDDEICLIEAGTGTGKSLAYLLPALLWALENKERTVVSTNTINLQEQLINKDIPLICKALKMNIKAVLVKGMSNYLCLRRLSDTLEESSLLSSEETDQLQIIDAWRHKAHSGSKSDLPIVPLRKTWDRVCVEADTCNHVKCPHHKNCYFFKARKEAANAQILIVNHHLLFADLAARSETDNYTDVSILPNYCRVILDEAHHIEDIATEYFADHASRATLMRTMAKLASERTSGQGSGKLPLLRKKFQEHFGQKPEEHLASIYDRLNVDLPAMRRELLTLIGDAFSILESFVKTVSHQDSDDLREEIKLRLLKEHDSHKLWTHDVRNSVLKLKQSIDNYVQSLNSLNEDIESFGPSLFLENTHGLRSDLVAYSLRLSKFAEILKDFVSEEYNLQRVRWIALGPHYANVEIVSAELDVSKPLVEFLFRKFSTVVLCSATLTTNQQFTFVRQRLGINSNNLPDKRMTENIFASPFNYQQQAMLVVPSDLPPPSDSRFIAKASELIWQTVSTSRGNAFVLFTSYGMLKLVYQELQEKFERHRYLVMKQGDDHRQSLLNKFKNNDYSVLFGTDSFWEGVDVVGEALRCVILVKLPFQVPSEPIIEARSEALRNEGRNPFLEYAVPQAIVKFKQGFGRLIRNKRDRGCIVCLDSRLMTKSYGRSFVNSLPPCRYLFKRSEEIQQEIYDFYRKTYARTKDWSVTGSNR